MANKQIFSSSRGKKVKSADTKNAAGGKAYKMSSKAALARYAATGCFNNTYYTKAEKHLETVLELAKKCDSEFIAKLAVYTRRENFMKDMPAFLLAYLTSRNDAETRKLVKAAFPLVINNGKMLQNFVQIMRSGQIGRKSLGSFPRNLVRSFMLPRSMQDVKFERPYWNDEAASKRADSEDANWLFRQLSVGQNPSGADIIKMVRPKGATPEYDALFGYLIGKVKSGSEKWDNLPPVVKQFEAWKRDKSIDPPKVDFRLLTGEKLSGEQWAKVLRKGNWHFLLKNLNTAIRHDALKVDKGLEEFIAKTLSNKNIIRKVGAMPYQLYAAYKYVDPIIPRSIVEAIHDATEISVDNVPSIKGNTVIVIDVSGSMSMSITGSGGRVSSKITCIDVASLFTTAIVRKNRNTKVIPVSSTIKKFIPEPRNTILTEAQRLSSLLGGGTELALAFHEMVRARVKIDNVIVISDQESWITNYSSYFSNIYGTSLMNEWSALKSKNPNAKMVCIDIVPGRTHQTDENDKDILIVSGWNDSVFKVASSFLQGDSSSWVEVIDSISLNIEN